MLPMVVAIGLTSHAGIRLAEFGFLLAAFAEISLSLAGPLLIIATRRGHFGSDLGGSDVDTVAHAIPRTPWSRHSCAPRTKHRSCQTVLSGASLTVDRIQVTIVPV